LRSPKIQNLIQGTKYKITVRNPQKDLAASVEELLAQPALIRQRRGKEYDLRPLINALAVGEEGDQIDMHLSALPGATGRPDEVLLALGIDPHTAHVHRTGILLEN